MNTHHSSSIVHATLFLYIFTYICMCCDELEGVKTQVTHKDCQCLLMSCMCFLRVSVSVLQVSVVTCR